MGVSENVVYPLYPMVLLIIIPMKNGYFIGNIPNIFRQTHMVQIFMTLAIDHLVIFDRFWEPIVTAAMLTRTRSCPQFLWLYMVRYLQYIYNIYIYIIIITIMIVIMILIMINCNNDNNNDNMCIYMYIYLNMLYIVLYNRRKFRSQTSDNMDR